MSNRPTTQKGRPGGAHLKCLHAPGFFNGRHFITKQFIRILLQSHIHQQFCCNTRNLGWAGYQFFLSGRNRIVHGYKIFDILPDPDIQPQDSRPLARIENFLNDKHSKIGQSKFPTKFCKLANIS